MRSVCVCVCAGAYSFQAEGGVYGGSQGGNRGGQWERDPGICDPRTEVVAKEEKIYIVNCRAIASVVACLYKSSVLLGVCFWPLG